MLVYGYTPEFKSKQFAPNVYCHKITREVSRVLYFSFGLTNLIGVTYDSLQIIKGEY